MSTKELHVQVQLKLFEELSQRQFAYEALIESLSEIVFQCHEDSSLLFLNPAWDQQLGYVHNDCYGNKLLDYLTDDKQRQWLHNAFLSENKLDCEIAVTAHNANTLLFSLRAVKRSGRWHGSMFNITEHKATISALKDSEANNQKLSLVASKTDNAVVITDAKGEIEWVNESFETMTGYTFEECKGRRPGDFLQGDTSDPQTITLMQDAVSAGKPFSVNIINYRKSGEPFWVAIACTPVFDEQGNLSTFIAIERDISEQKAEELAQQTAVDEAIRLNKAKSRFLANISHEIRTPLNALLGITSLLSDSEMRLEQRALLETMQQSGNALLSLVNDVLDHAKLESDKLTMQELSFELDEPFEQVIDIVQTDFLSKGLYLYLFFDNSVPHKVVGDPNRLRQIILNLVSNAVKFTEKGGVWLNVSWESKGQQNGELIVTIEDTGKGIESARLATLFGEFVQEDESISRKHGGTGLGLAICRRLCEKMAGGIRLLHSKKAQGTTIEFRVSLSDATFQNPQAEFLLKSGIKCAQWKAIVSSMASRFGSKTDWVNTGCKNTLLIRTDANSRKCELDLWHFNNILSPKRLYQFIVNMLTDKTELPKGGEMTRLSQKILIVEDSPANQLVLKGMLKKLGYSNVTVASDGIDALRIMENELFDMIFTDLHMPNMDGPTFIQNVKANTTIIQPRLIACSADDSFCAIDKKSQLGVDGLLTKPIMRHELVAILQGPSRN